MHVYVFHYYTKIGHFRRHHYQHHWVKCHYILMCGSYAEQNVSRELRELTNERHFLWPCDTGITARTGHSYKHVTGGGGDFPSGTQENFGNCTWYVTTQQKAAYVAHTKQI